MSKTSSLFCALLCTFIEIITQYVLCLFAIIAKMKSVLACYGYLKTTDDIQSWGADFFIHHPDEIISLVNS